MRSSLCLAAAAAFAFAAPVAAAPEGPAPVGPPIGAYVVWGVVGGVAGGGIGYGVANMIVSANRLTFGGSQAGDNARTMGAMAGVLTGAFLGVALTGPLWDAWTPALNLRVLPAAGAGRGGLVLLGRF